MNKREELRNIAIIAHVDHGKTTLVDQMLRQSGTFRENEHVSERAMDRNDLERERGITILAKNTSLAYNGNRINVVDTPGHADFGGEVERIMKMVDGVLLLVDAYEGVMPQTRFVLKKALEAKLKPIVVVNKIDKPMARPEAVIDEVLELFIDLGADDDQLEFPVVYASAVNGVAGTDPEDVTKDMSVIFDIILEHVPAPVDNSDEPLQFQVTMLDYNDYVGRIGIGRIFRGSIKVGQQAVLVKTDGSQKAFRITKIFGFFGLKREEIDEAKAGDLIAISGVEDINIGETINTAGHVDPLPLLTIDEPTLQMTFLANTSPFAGREGQHVTSRKLEERLLAELERDVSLRVEMTDSPDKWVVSGRGELHLSILIENMRREGYELAVSKPSVIVKEIDGVLSEPYERVHIDVPGDYSGSVIESMGIRKAELQNMEQQSDGHFKLEFIAPSRGLIGYRRDFLTETRGYGIMNHTFDHYRPVIKEAIGGRRQGVLVAMETGQASAYGMMQLEDRGTMFIEPGTQVYEGMIVGEHTRENDLTVNVTKTKHQTNVRSATKDQTVTLKSPRILSLEDALSYLDDDEYCEITPENIRLRKKYLNKNEREKAEKRKKVGSK
ncbi:GTP-binding protein [Pullulanibacillus pueri]|uniref:Large ribosomal subunit assembly factor BipA n=1 Tax=Pullulanibacillus pueri TaxID=1437324 RepID=A0A8J3EJT5_9BACL|nr:translational GTPase TypA [Pullulanibacillus pueri]MBM7680087.1 GTP-binding protein [Pullulanibacillus pueri]GGH74304.1 GTP-binding protein [Pullulanibacillus pueri]